MTRILSFTFIFLTAVVVAYFMYFRPENDLPVYQPSQLNPALVDPSMVRVEDHRIMDFELINHLGDTVVRSDVEGQILIVDFFFTRCATICPLMTKNLQRVHDRLDPTMPVHILSHSVTPVADSVSVLEAYAQKHGADPRLWWFLTGPKDHIYELARKSYFACLDEGDGGFQDFVHTENVVLVDGQGRLRGFYDGTDAEAMSQLFRDLTFLIKKKSEKS
ncbi:MAG: SCO family protein [Bacteroidetes bacterium]|nr:SCO family protein [Bacteroidota bacterium]MDA0904524.1 SCO family protein [Bacteroidota bacterium]